MHFDIFNYILITLSVCYFLLLMIYVIAWWRCQADKNESSSAKTKVSILIPCRNEAANLKALLTDLENQTYSKLQYEILVLDDFSNDETVDLALNFNGQMTINVFKLSDYIEENKSSKKAALTFGVGRATGDLIITVDADCQMDSDWLTSMVQFYENYGKKIFSAPIVYDPVQGLVSTFEALDVAGMMMITGGMHRAKLGLLCNGANLAFEKSAFIAVNGYEGKDQMASGDDMFLMEKINKRFPGSAGFLKSRQAIVRTKPQGSWTKFINQRTRWASKNHQYESLKLPIQLFIPVALCWLLVIGFILSLFGLISIVSVLLALAIKVLADFILQITATHFFRKYHWLTYFPLAAVLHILYLVQVSIKTLFGGFSWKGRKY